MAFKEQEQITKNYSEDLLTTLHSLAKRMA